MRTGAVRIGMCCNGSALLHPVLSIFVAYFVMVPTCPTYAQKNKFCICRTWGKMKVEKARDVVLYRILDF